MKKEEILNRTDNKPDTKENMEPVLPVNNDIRVVIKSKEDGILFDQDCCSVINIILNNYNEIATSFLGIHSEDIIKQLWKAQKSYFKALKKTLKEERRRAYDTAKNEEDQQEKTNEKKNVSKDEAYHIKEFDKDNADTTTPTNKEENKQVIENDSSSFEHICDENGCRLVKKKIDPKTSPDTALHKSSSKSANKKSRSNKNSTKPQK